MAAAVANAAAAAAALIRLIPAALIFFMNIRMAIHNAKSSAVFPVP